MKAHYRGLLLIIPVIYLILGYYFNDIIGLLSLRNVDPEYIYLTNGLYMSTGDPNVSHIDNPGTPLQIIVALTCRLVYLFRPHDLPYIEDVLANSDLYMNVINHVVNLITALVMYFSASMLLRITSFLPYALLLQSAPFFSQITYEMIGRLVPELLISIPVLFLTVLMIKTSMEGSRKLSRKEVLLFGIISGFGLSIKLTYLPLLITPLLLIPGIRDKLRYILFTVLSLFVFAIPILFDLLAFTGWIVDLFLGSGQYGGGETSVINPESFSQNLQRIRQSHFFFLMIWSSGAVVMALYLALKRKNLNKNLVYGLGGVLLTLLLQVFIVSKHYEYRYLVPGLALFPAMVILTLQTLKEILPIRRFSLLVIALIIAGSAIMIPRHIRTIRFVAGKMQREMEGKLQTKYFVESLGNDAVKLLTPNMYGCPFHDYAMMFSSCWAGKANRDFQPVYRKLYPDTYFYFTWEGQAKHWYTPYDISKIVNSDRPVYFYLGKYSRELYDNSLKAMLCGYDIDTVDSTLVFENQLTGEKIFRLCFKSKSNPNKRTNSDL